MSGAPHRSTVRALAAGCALGAGASWHITNAGAIASRLARHYSIGLGSVGLLTSVLFFAELAFMLPAGRTIDRFGPRPVAVAGLALAGATNLVLLAGGGLALALCMRALAGLGAAAAFLGGAAYVQRAVDSPLAQGVYGGAGLATGGITLAIVPRLAGPLGWRAPWLLAALGSFACLALALIGPVAAAERTRPDRSMLDLVTDFRITCLGALHAASFGASVVLGNWLVPLLQHAGHGADFAGAASALTLVIGVIARPAGGWMARRGPLATRFTLIAGLVVGALGAMVLALDPSLGLVAVVGAALLGTGCALPFGVLLTAGARTAPGAAGSALAALNSYALAAIIVATPLLGASFSLPGAGRIGFGVVAVLCVAALPAVGVCGRASAAGMSPSATASHGAGGR